MSKVDKTIWGRKLQLKVIYDCFEDEEIAPSQKKLFLPFWETAPRSSYPLLP